MRVGFIATNSLVMRRLVSYEAEKETKKPMPQEKPQGARRVSFEHPLPVHIMAIDGTWRRSCVVRDVSDSGATLLIEDSIQGLALNEFFLLLSSTGLAYRRCQLDGVNGAEITVSFLRHKDKRKKPTRSPDDLV